MANHLKEIKKSVSFIFTLDATGNPVANGTGFFVGVKANDDKAQTYHLYFVTARHVLKNQNGQYWPKIYLRLDKKIGDAEFIEVALGSVQIFEHSDKDVDVALFACLPDQNVYDFRFIPDELIAHNEILKKHAIAEGDDVFFAGLFTSHIGQKRNQPIIRFGKVAYNNGIILKSIQTQG